MTKPLSSWAMLLVGTALMAAPAAAQELQEGAAEREARLEFPRVLSTASGSVVVHTPQIDSWHEFATLKARAAVTVTPAGADEAVYGVAEFTARTDPNLELRVVAIEAVEITVTSFPVSDPARREELDAIVRDAVQPQTHYLPLDVILSYIAVDDTVGDEAGLSFEPPPVFYSSTPAILVMTDGEPLLAPIPETRLEYAVNTNWDLFHYREREWYLRVSDRWLRSADLAGGWRWDSKLPKDFRKLPDDSSWADARAANPPAKGEAAVPTVFVSDRPAELIVTDGAPNFRSIGGPGLAYVPNTQSDLFRYEQAFYYLVSGRWFSAAALRGPWQHVEELPAVFAAIDPEHDKGHVLAAVPGTDEARLAVLEAMLPRKATVSRDAGDKVNVFFQGEPEFEPISGTSIERAVNSYNDILKIGAEYYLCADAVWYVAMSLEGPWRVADSIPAVVYEIPPSSPSYHVTHVHVYGGDDDSVETGYTSGYFSVHLGFGVAMYGTGFYYPSYYGYYPYYGYPFYPYYYPYPYSYGAAAWYNPKTGMYGRSGSVYGPYGGYGRAAAYNPETGTYARGQAVWDSNEIAGSGVAYNPRTGTGVATNRYANEKGGWGESLVTHNEKWLQTQSEWDKDSRTTRLETSEGGAGKIVRSGAGEDAIRSGAFRTGDGDVYAGRDGNVYRRDENGWSKHGEDGWSPVDLPDEGAARTEQARGRVTEARETVGQSAAVSRPTREQVHSTLGSRGFAESYGAADSRNYWSDRTFDSSRAERSFDGSRRAELDRSHSARTNGYQRYNTRSLSSREFNRPARQRPVRRR